MPATLADLVEEWIHFHPKLYNHFKVEKYVDVENPTHWPFDQDAFIGITCEMRGSARFLGENAVATIASDMIIVNPNTIIAAEPNFLKTLEDWLVTYHNNSYHQI